MFERTHAVGSLEEFKRRVVDNAITLKSELGLPSLRYPIGIFLVLDTPNGGDQSGEEIIRRFNLLDLESRDGIDFFFLGWNRMDENDKLKFSLSEFQVCREALEKLGIQNFGGYSDLILFDACIEEEEIILDFENCLQIDLSESLKSGKITSIGRFLEGLVDVIHRTLEDHDHLTNITVKISDRLGLIAATRSLLNYILEKLGSIIGAKSLVHLAIRKAASPTNIADL